MMKRLFDLVGASIGLIVTGPIIVVVSAAIWLQDFSSPLYVATRVGRNERPFRMVKFRSMIVRADKSGVDSTAADDSRLTSVGRFIRRFKIDELPQLWNVLAGEMSFVGPRPNVERETTLYTAVERKLLSVRPGITDLASIVFSDEAEVLRGSSDPDLRYHQLIRPGKSGLGLLYVRNIGSLTLDLRIIGLTALSIVDRQRSLRGVSRIVSRLDGGEALARLALRSDPLVAAPPPGASEIVRNRWSWNPA